MLLEVFGNRIRAHYDTGTEAIANVDRSVVFHVLTIGHVYRDSVLRLFTAVHQILANSTFVLHLDSVRSKHTVPGRSQVRICMRRMRFRGYVFVEKIPYLPMCHRRLYSVKSTRKIFVINTRV